MAEFILSEKQLKLINNNINFNINLESAQENWLKLSTKEKEFIIEIAKLLYPYNSKLLKEAKWYNTLGDIVGIFDPTGVVDLVNGISYIKQGDNLFGFLSIVSAVPYFGDAIAKPVMGALKIGAPSAKLLESILKMANLAKSEKEFAKVASELARLESKGGPISFFVKQFGKVSGKLRAIIERSPGGVLKGLKDTILQWINLFEKSSVAGKAIRGNAGKFGAEFATNAAKFATKAGSLSKSRQIAQLSQLAQEAKRTPGLFTGYRTANKLFSSKTLYGGMPRLIGQNKSVRALMRKTKFWAGFLDWMGLVNFVGPDELIGKMGEGNFQNKMEEYQKTSEAQQYYYDDFGNEMPQNSQASSSQSTETQKTDSSPIQSFVSSLFTGQVGKAALAAL
jgi:hypothetical protein